MKEPSDRIGTRTVGTRWRAALAGLALAAHLASGQIAGAQDWSIPASGFDADAPLAARPLADADTPASLGLALRVALDQTKAISERTPDLEKLALASMLEPEAAFAYVRDRLRTETYPGSLRDPQAVLEAGGGNDHDKARLLAALLGQLGYDARLVSADRPEDLARRIEAAACRAGDRGTADIDPLTVWNVSGLGADGAARVRTRAQASFDALSAVALPEPPAAGPGAPAAGPHYWVQMRLGGDWVDLDPALAETAFGVAPAGPGAPLGAEVEPQRIVVRLTLETLANGRLQKTDILTQTLDVAQAAEKPISLFFGPRLGGVGGGVLAALGGLQGQAEEMVATLMIDDKPVTSRGFPEPGAGVPGAAEAFFGAAQDRVTTGLWLTLTARVPGGAEEVAERTILDLVPAELRAAGATPAPEQLVAPAQGEKYAAPLESLRQIVVSNGGLSARLASARMTGVLLDLPEALRLARAETPDPEIALWNSWVQTSTVALISEALVRARSPAADGSCATMGRPRALIWGVEVLPGDGIAYWLDWALDEIGVAGAAEPVAARPHRIWHGAVQGALETEALLTFLQVPEGDVPIDPGALAELDGAALEGLGAAAQADREAGFTVLAGPRMAGNSWWRVDPVSGRTDARIAAGENSLRRKFFPRPGEGNTRIGDPIDVRNADAIFADPDQIAQDAIQEAMEAMEDAERKQRQASRRTRGRGGNEYTIILFNVSIPISVATGAAVGSAVISGLLYALLG